MATSTLLALAFWLPMPFIRPVERTDPAAWSALLAEFTVRGVAIISDHPRCQEANLYGLYLRGSRTVVVCNRGDRSSTLRHEGWHLVQSQCLQGRPWLSSEQIEQRLSRDDRIELQALVQPERRQRESEARAMAQLNITEFVEQLDQACRDRLGPTPGGSLQNGLPRQDRGALVPLQPEHSATWSWFKGLDQSFVVGNHPHLGAGCLRAH